MPRVRLFHWKATEAKDFIESLRAAGYHVHYDEKLGSGLFSRIRAAQPDAFVIVLSRLPSHGREVATFLRGSKITRHIPIVFVDGASEKIDFIRKHIPDAVYTSGEQMCAVVRRALAHAPPAPVVPVQMMDRYAGRTAAQKLGIREGRSIALVDAPRDYASVLGKMPAGVTLTEVTGEPCAVTLWFVEDADRYRAGLPHARTLAARSKLWILWPKGGQRFGISQQLIRDSAAIMGLVDYKICSVNPRWSAMAFARRKVGPS